MSTLEPPGFEPGNPWIGNPAPQPLISNNEGGGQFLLLKSNVPYNVSILFKGKNKAQKVKFYIKDFFSKCDQIRMRIWSHLLKKFLMENYIFCAVK